jgi:NAD(P)-dependent dehydrogenase (short-subunit alcohol dehydrogenase family)
VLFNNAGIAGAQTPLVDFPQDVFERVLQVNLMGTLLGMKHVLPTMIAQGSGAIASGRRQPRRCADNTAAFS